MAVQTGLQRPAAMWEAGRCQVQSVQPELALGLNTMSQERICERNTGITSRIFDVDSLHLLCALAARPVQQRTRWTNPANGRSWSIAITCPILSHTSCLQTPSGRPLWLGYC